MRAGVTITLNDLRDVAHAQAKKSGFYDGLPDPATEDGYDLTLPAILPAKLMLIVSEVSEMMEADRKHRGMEEFTEEMADTFIRLFDLAGWLEIDLDKAISRKMAKNAVRPVMHGGRKY